MIVALAGGVGGARLAVGLAALLEPEDLTIVVNTGDDFEHLGFAISPDLDTVMYTLAGVADPERGWGRAAETWSFMDTLATLGGDTWFRLGDRDLAVHVARTQALAAGKPLSEVTRELAQRFGVKHAIVPMSDTPVRTMVLTNGGKLPFQDYFVRRGCEPIVTGFLFAGADRAEVPSALKALVDSGDLEAAIVCPSNPYISVGPMLAVSEIRGWLERRSFPVVGVSPIIGGQAVKGPAAKMMRELGLEASALAIARHYGPLVDAWLIDTRDAGQAAEIRALGKRVEVTDTLMPNPGRSKAVAQALVGLAHACRSRPR
jgi:LPPG:FO 2-phospho-L-lactate transferase